MNKKGLFTVFLLLALMFCLIVHGEEEQGIPYHHVDFDAILKADGTAEITRWNKEGEIVIPDTLEGHTVTVIGERAIGYKITAVTLPESLMNMGLDVFRDCGANFQFTVTWNSWAERWCEENGKNYAYPDNLDWLND